MTKLVKTVVKAVVATGAFVLSYKTGECIGRAVQESDSIDVADKEIVTTVSCFASGYAIGAIAKRIIKHI